MDLILVARDGVKLAASLFEPAAPNGGALLINSGTGIPRQFYGAFAQHLANRGFVVLTYDYRCIGGSQQVSDATIEHWGAIDQPSMLDQLAALAPDCALGIVGHSFGGQVLGLADNVASVQAAVLIATQSGHWRHWPPGRRRLRMLALWWLLIPGLTALTGRFPGSWVGTADLPKGIARSWARWGRSRHYVCDARLLSGGNHRAIASVARRSRRAVDRPFRSLSQIHAKAAVGRNCRLAGGAAGG